MAPIAEPLLSETNPPPPENIDEAEWGRMGIRERYRYFYTRCSAANSTLPVFTIFAFYTIVGLVWLASWYYIGMDRSLSLFNPTNARRFIVFNILHGITGLGATCGPLGGKHKVPFFACFLTFLTPGTLSSPLLPGVVGLFQKIPARRGPLAVLAFAVYYLSMVRALFDPSAANIIVACACLGVATIFDAVIFFASRGEHYGYHLICLMWPDWIAGVQCSHLCLYFFVGLSKVGPWFKYVVLVLVKDAVFTPFLPKHTLAKWFYKDWPRDHSPATLPRLLHALGYLLEWVFPACMLFTPGSTINKIGVVGMVVYHGFVWATLPMASVFEWQYYCIYVNMFFFGYNSFSLPTSPGLIAFILFTGFFLPIVGQLRPEMVPFLMAYRQYAGNWRLGTWIVKREAAHKLDRIKCYNKVLWMLDAPASMGGDRADFAVMSAFTEVPQFRGTITMMEKFLQDRAAKPDDFWFVSTFNVANSLFGWDLALGWTTYRDCVRKALVEMCDFKPGEAWWMLNQPSGILPPWSLKYQIADVTKGPQDAELYIEIPYKDLEGTHPLEVYLDESKIKRGNSINGMIFSTYY